MRKGASFRCALLGLVLIAATVAAQARSSYSGYPLISDAIHLTVTTEASAEP
jgi:hypothetical protein